MAGHYSSHSAPLRAELAGALSREQMRQVHQKSPALFPIWFLNSNYHLEHLYFPGVPFYNLPALQRMLAPFYERHQIPWRGYGHLVKGWLFDNRAPHTNWDLA